MAFTKAPLRTLAFAAPLALVLAACNGSEEGGAQEGDPIEAIPAPDGASWLDTVTVSEDGEGYILGNPDAPLKLAEYASHTCSACANFAQTGKEPLKKYVETGVVSFEQREVFLNTFDVVIATIVQCGEPGQVQALSDEMWQNFQPVMTNIQGNQEGVNAASQLPPEQRFAALGDATGLIDFFAARGISADQARTCLNDFDKIEALTKSVGDKATEAGVTGTPTFTLNGRTLEERGWADLEVVLQKAGAR
ncbi:MAG: thioredoxin domain-containing protein [Pseudomonadota bacterium]